MFPNSIYKSVCLQCVHQERWPFLFDMLKLNWERTIHTYESPFPVTGTHTNSVHQTFVYSILQQSPSPAILFIFYFIIKEEIIFIDIDQREDKVKRLKIYSKINYLEFINYLETCNIRILRFSRFIIELWFTETRFLRVILFEILFEYVQRSNILFELTWYWQWRDRNANYVSRFTIVRNYLITEIILSC